MLPQHLERDANYSLCQVNTERVAVIINSDYTNDTDFLDKVSYGNQRLSLKRLFVFVLNIMIVQNFYLRPDRSSYNRIIVLYVTEVVRDILHTYA